MGRFPLAAFVLITGVIPLPAAADPILVNGSFEVGPPPFDIHDIDIEAGSNAITGWTILAGGVDLLEDPWDVSDGLRAVDLDRRSPGGITQSFSTIVGQEYRVSFDLSGNPGGGEILKMMRASVGGVSVDYAFSVAGLTIDALVWRPIIFSFVADDTLAALTFLSLSDAGSSYGALIDNVQVSAVPEPGTSALLAVGLGYCLLRKLRA